jgi:hypothetical protein
MASNQQEDNGLEELRRTARELRQAVEFFKTTAVPARPPDSIISLPSEASSWNFITFEKYINQRFSDLSLQLRERYEAQQTGLAAALAAAEKAVNAALIAAEKAVDKAEGAQQLRNEAQNEFRASLSDLSKLMWTRLEGAASVDALRREIQLTLDNLVTRVGLIETGYSNIQGKIWAVGAIWSIIVLAASIGVRFIGHN